MSFTLTAPHTHAWAAAWSSDATYHWHACTGAGATNDCLNEAGAAKATHTYGDAGDERFTCTVCENVDATRQAAAALADAKTGAASTVNGVNANDYITDDQATVTSAKTTALAAIEAATTEAEVTTALNTFNIAIAGCTTQAAQAAAALADAKTSAANTVNGVNANDYVADDQATVTSAKDAAMAAIDAATTEDEVAAALNAFNTAIAGCTTQAAALAAAQTNAVNTVNGVNANNYVAADQETVTNAKATALKAIDAATTRAAVTETLNAFNSAVAGCTTQAAADASAAVSGDVAPVGVTVEETVATVTDAGIDEALAAPEADAVTVDMSALKTEITEVVIPSAILTKVAEAVADENNSADGLEIKLTEGTIRLNAEAVAAIKEQAGGRDLHVSLNSIQAEDLNQAQQDAIKDMEALAMYEASILVDGQRVEISGGSKVTAAVKVELAEDQSESGVRVFSVNEAGDRTEVPMTWENGEAKFSVDSFSKYIVTCDAAK